MPKSSFIDFKAVKAAITMEQVLQHYGLLDQFKRSGDSLSGPCPIHKGSNPTQFRVSVSKNLWNCFSECKGGGNSLDFIARMEDATIHAAALKAIDWFGLDAEAMKTNSKDADKAPNGSRAKDTGSEQKTSSKPAAPAPEKDAPNKPLGFRLEKLNPAHPYLEERGLTPETIAEFGLGYCAKGMMAGRIAIPIHNVEGKVVAYAGRIPEEPAGDTAKYKLPPGFRKSLELFNIDRATKEPPEKPLVLVEGFFDCMKLYQQGYRKVVALMGSTMSPAQEALVRTHTTTASQVVVMLDEDEAGRAGRDDIAARLAKLLFVRIHVFPKERMQPDQLSPEEVNSLLGGAA
jgi:DNA primase